MPDTTQAPGNEPTKALTKRTLDLDALDKDRAGKVSVSAMAGGIAFANALEVMEFAKLMSLAEQAIPEKFRRNPGMCLAITMQAIEWRMSPFAVVNKAYVVNDRIAWESQLLHAVVEARAPLLGRLRCTYDGEGLERTCTVSGMFIGEDEPHEYTSPKLKDIKTKNSPLWSADTDQQLWYYSSRSWARKWCPDVLLGIYTRDELSANPRLGRDEEPIGPTLQERLAKTNTTAEGFKDGHIERELAQVVAGNPRQEILPPESQDGGASAAAQGQPATKASKRTKPTGDAPKAAAEPSGDPPRATTLTNPKDQPSKAAIKAAADRAEAASKAKETPAAPPATPKTPEEYEVYCKAWITVTKDPDNVEARWDSEREMRDDIGVSIKARKELEKLVQARCEELRR